MSSLDDVTRYERIYQRMRQCSSYHLRRFAVHLYEAGEHEKLYQLLAGNKAWLDVKFIEFQGDTAYLDDINIALRAYQDPLLDHQYLPLLGLHTLRYVLRQRVQAINDDGIRGLVWLNKIDEAYKLIQLRTSLREQLKGLITLCIACYQSNQPFKKHLKECLKQYNDLSIFQEMVEIILPLAQMLALCHAPQAEEYFDKAIDLTNHHADKLRRPGNLYEISQALAQVGCLEKAQQTADLITDEEEISTGKRRSKAFQNVSIILAEQGFFQEALSICDTRISSHTYQNETLLTLAQIASKSSLSLSLAIFSKARQHHRSLPPHQMLKTLAMINAHSGKPVQAVKIALRISEPLIRGKALIELLSCVDAYLHTMIIDHLYYTLNLMPDGDKRIELFSQAIFAITHDTAQPATDFLEALLETVNRISHRHQGKLLRETMGLLAESGEIETAEKLLHSIRDHYVKFSLTSNLAAHLARIGHLHAQLLLEEARLMRTENYNPVEAVAVVLNLSILLHKQGLFRSTDLFDQTLLLTVDTGKQIEMLLDAAVKIAHLDPAQTTVYFAQCEKLLPKDKILAPHVEQKWIPYIKALATVSRYEQAEKYALALSLDYLQVHGLLLIADMMCKEAHPQTSRLLHQLKALVPIIQDPLERALMLCALARLLNQYKDLEAENYLNMAADATYNLNELWTRGTAETDLIAALHWFGFEEEAKEAHSSLPIIEMRSSVFLSFIEFELEQSNFERALDIAATIPDDQHREEAFRIIGVALIKAGFLCRGLRTINLPNMGQFLETLSESLSTKAGLPAETVIRTLMETVRIAGWINSYWKQSYEKFKLFLI